MYVTEANTCFSVASPHLIVNCGRDVFLFVCFLIYFFIFFHSPEEYYLLDILDYIYRLIRKELPYYNIPRNMYK